jgi:hypothetical protein
MKQAIYTCKYVAESSRSGSLFSSETHWPSWTLQAQYGSWRARQTPQLLATREHLDNGTETT